jgi:hypothetical protein
MGTIVTAMVVMVSAAPTSAQGVGLPSPPPEDLSQLGEYYQKFGMAFQKYGMSFQQKPGS